MSRPLNVQGRSSGSPRLVVEKGKQTGREFAVDDGAKLGRDPGCAIFLDDENASREHAQVRVAKGRVQIVDLQSTNGMLVNGAKVKQAVLASDDLVRIGDTTLRFRAEEAAGRSSGKHRVVSGEARPGMVEAALVAAVIVLVFLVTSYATQIFMRLGN